MENRVRLQFDDALDVIEGICTNISIGGMQVATDDPRPRGSLVRFDLEIEEGMGIRGLGEVVWMRTDSPLAGRGPGMGIKFRFIEQRDRQLIYKIVSEHIKERLAHKHPSLEEPAGTLPEMPEVAESPSPEAPVPIGGGTVWEDDEPLEPPAPSYQETRPLDLDESFLSTNRPSEDAEPRTGDGFAPPPAFSPEGSFDEAPEDVDVAEHRYRVGELYHPRPARRREFPAVTVVLLLLLVGVVIVYVYWDDLTGPSSPEAAPTAASTQDEAAGVPDPGDLEGESPPPVDEPPLSIATDEPPDAGSRAEPARNPPPPPPPEPEPPPPPPPRARPFTLVENISWTRTPGGVKIEIETNGAIPQDRYSHFRLEGENPREVVKLTGVVRQFERGTIPVSGAAVSQIRVGYHPGPRELHVVLDMRDRSTRISRLRSEGSKLEVYLE